MKTFRINRNKWGRGMGVGELWNSDNEVGCCLGHITRQHNHCSWEELEGKAYPKYKNDDYVEDQAKYACPITNIHTLKAAAKINDNAIISDKEREEKLIKLMSKHGIKLEFYN
jgi:hypothetical protein